MDLTTLSCRGEWLEHTLPFSLPWGHGSIGYFADGPADRLVIFIHGFGGKAVKTWSGMEALLQDPKARSADILFYGYGSLAAPARNSAGLFRTFVNSAASLTPQWLNTVSRAGAPAGKRDYQDILIVAHSLGAVVVRRALLDSLSLSAPWMSRTRILLFGPAHMGTRLIKLSKMLQSGLGSILSDFFTFARVKIPVLDDLEPGSDFLKELLDQTKQALANGVAEPLRAEAVIFGERDDVVITTPFAGDPISDVWQDEDHCSVCRSPQTAYVVAEFL